MNVSNKNINNKIKDFKKEVIFFDKDFVEFEVKISLDNECNNRESHFSICTNSRNGGGQCEFKPADIFQQHLKNIWDRYHLQESKNLPNNLEQVIELCIENIEDNNKRNILNRRDEFNNGNDEYHSVLKDTESFLDDLTSDIADSRDLQERIEKLEAFIIMQYMDKKSSMFSIDDLEQSDEYLELRQLKDFKIECDMSNGDRFEDGQTIIHEDYFEDYAKEQAESCGYLKDTGTYNNPLNNHINWESWAEALKEDYIEVEYCGEVYYVY
jgi:hypothetical protein